MPTIIQATSNENPDSTQAGAEVVTSPSLTGHAATTSDELVGAEESASETRCCRWFAFTGPGASAISLQFTWSISGSITLTGAAPDTTVGNASYRVEYTTDGGSNWSTAITRSFTRNTSGTTTISDGATENITLPTVSLNQIQVRDRIRADASSTGDPSVSAAPTITATISDIQLSVEPFSPNVIWMG
jgi:hypothetical protein